MMPLLLRFKRFIEFLIPNRKIVLSYNYRKTFGFSDEEMTPSELQALKDTAHIHLKVIVNKLKVVLVEGADNTDYAKDKEKWYADKALQAGSEKVLNELMNYYLDIIDAKPSEAEKVDDAHW